MKSLFSRAHEAKVKEDGRTLRAEEDRQNCPFEEGLPECAILFVDTRSSETLLKRLLFTDIRRSFDNWEEGFFRALFRLQEVVIFDEFQNFMRVDQSVFSILQKVWDENSGRSLLILCGSYVGMMKRIFLDQKAPLFGRCDHKVELKQFRFREALEMIRSFGYSFEEAVEWYSITRWYSPIFVASRRKGFFQ